MTLLRKGLDWIAYAERFAFWKTELRLAGSDEMTCLRSLAGPSAVIDRAVVDSWVQELRDDVEIRASLERNAIHLDNRQDLDQRTAGSWRGRTVFLYILIRLLRPEVVVETGSDFDQSGDSSPCMHGTFVRLEHARNELQES